MVHWLFFCFMKFRISWRNNNKILFSWSLLSWNLETNKSKCQNSEKFVTHYYNLFIAYLKKLLVSIFEHCHQKTLYFKIKKIYIKKSFYLAYRETQWKVRSPIYYSPGRFWKKFLDRSTLIPSWQILTIIVEGRTSYNQFNRNFI